MPYFYGWVKAQWEKWLTHGHTADKWWSWNWNPGLLATRVAFRVWARLGVIEGPTQRGLWLYLLSPARLAKQLGLESLLSSSIRVSSAGNLRMYLLLVSDVKDVSLWVQRSWLMSKGRGQIPPSLEEMEDKEPMSNQLGNFSSSPERSLREGPEHVVPSPNLTHTYGLLYGERFHPFTERLCETGLGQDWGGGGGHL